MKNNARYPEFTTLTAYALYPEITGLKIKEETFHDFAYFALDKIGRNVEICKIQSKVEENGMVFLPCNVTQIKKVSDDFDSFDQWDAGVFDGDRVTFNRMGDTRGDLSPSTNRFDRQYIDFKFYSPNVVQVDERLEGKEIFILASAPMVNKKGEALLYYKQAEAVLYYVAYLHQQRNSFMGIQGIDLGYIRNRALNAIADARIPDHISDNEWNKVLDAKVAMGRKGFNKDFKFE